MKNQVYLDEANLDMRQKLIDEDIHKEAAEFFPEKLKWLDLLPHRHTVLDQEEATNAILSRETREKMVDYNLLLGFERLVYVGDASAVKLTTNILSEIALRRYEDDSDVEFF
ncbi:hypothetical protein JXM67_05955 [candidate division WOR-3 bacterium]|nr:hypothetical protein [candidate division WOR-3 bacterium]